MSKRSFTSVQDDSMEQESIHSCHPERSASGAEESFRYFVAIAPQYDKTTVIMKKLAIQ